MGKQFVNIDIDCENQHIKIGADIREGSDELILFLHGIGCSKESFKDFWEAEAFDGYSAMALDLVGFGTSEKPRDFSYTMEAQAEVCDSALAWFEKNHGSLRHIYLVAHSMGGPVGLLLAEKLLQTSPAKVVTYFCLEGNLVAEDCGIVSRNAIKGSISDYEAVGHQRLIEVEKQAKNQSEQIWATMLATCTPYAFYRSAESLVAWSDSGKLLNSFKEFPLSKSYICGEENLSAPVVKYVSGIKIFAMPGSGHFMMLDNPNEFYKLLSDLLRN